MSYYISSWGYLHREIKLRFRPVYHSTLILNRAEKYEFQVESKSPVNIQERLLPNAESLTSHVNASHIVVGEHHPRILLLLDLFKVKNSLKVSVKFYLTDVVTGTLYI